MMPAATSATLRSGNLVASSCLRRLSSFILSDFPTKWRGVQLTEALTTSTRVVLAGERPLVSPACGGQRMAAST